MYLVLAICILICKKQTEEQTYSRLKKCFSCCIKTIALWNIFIFIQSLAMSIIPIFVFLIVAPLQTISVLATLATLFLLLVAIVAVLLTCCITCKKSKCTVESVCHCVRVLAIIGFLGSIIIVLGICLFLWWRGVSPEGINGLIFSLFPPLILSAVGWCMQRFLKKDRNTDFWPIWVMYQDFQGRSTFAKHYYIIPRVPCTYIVEFCYTTYIT